MMNNWQKVNEAANILNVGKSFLRTVICREEFKNYVLNRKPLLINCCDELKELIKNYIKNAKINKDKKNNQKKKIKTTTNKRIIINESTLKRWTQSSVDCYSIGCNCSICKLKKIMSAKCQMKQVVIKLVKKFGAPNIERSDIL